VRQSVLAVSLLIAGMGGVQIPPTPSTIRILSNTITPEPPLRPNEPFHVIANHSIQWFTYATDGTTVIPCPPFSGQPPPNCFGDTTGYNLLIDGNAAMTKQWTLATNGLVDFYMSAGLPAGSYSIVVQSVGPGGTTGAVAVTLPVVQQ
jgi:hypothetical protein